MAKKLTEANGPKKPEAPPPAPAAAVNLVPVDLSYVRRRIARQDERKRLGARTPLVGGT